MNEARAIELLEQHGVKPTANRIVVAKALAAAENPMSLAELERKILTIDKSGIFRALTLFREHHLVHIIEGGGEGVKYEFCHSHSHEHDEDVHPTSSVSVVRRPSVLTTWACPTSLSPTASVPALLTSSSKASARTAPGDCNRLINNAKTNVFYKFHKLVNHKLVKFMFY